jgi:hypothetical protein
LTQRLIERLVPRIGYFFPVRIQVEEVVAARLVLRLRDGERGEWPDRRAGDEFALVGQRSVGVPGRTSRLHIGVNDREAQDPAATYIRGRCSHVPERSEESVIRLDLRRGGPTRPDLKSGTSPTSAGRT